MKKGLTVILAVALWFQGASALAVNIKGEMGTALIKELNRASGGKIPASTTLTILPTHSPSPLPTE